MNSGSLRFLSATLFAVLLILPMTLFAQTPVCGDENGNGALEPTDVFYLINHLFAGGPGPANCPLPAPVAKSGQTTCYDVAGTVIACVGTGQDGEKRKGVAWPNPRFTDNGNGTVTDNLTGLIWLKNADCAAISPARWAVALTTANTLASGACGLTDGSVAGDWRLPNRRELLSLIDDDYAFPALSNAVGTGHWTEEDAFSGVQSSYYWSSSTYAYVPSSAWVVYLHVGYDTSYDKTSTFYVWPVRGGQ